MIESIEMYILIFFTYSFAGWLMESFGSIFKDGKFVNRGFLIGPYCPVYGTGVVLISYLLRNYTNDIPVLFILSTLICGTLEYATSYFMEKFFNARWWDYSENKFNINGRICLETLLPFGIAGSTIICLINPFLVSIYSLLPNLALRIIAYGLVFMFFVDSLVSFKIILSFKKATYSKKDNTEEISNMVKEKAEDIIEKAESNVLDFSRGLKLKELKFQRKIHYSGKKIYKNIQSTPHEIAKMVNTSRNAVNVKIKENREKIDNKIKYAKNTIEIKQKESKESFDNAIKNIKMSSEEFTNEVKNKFKNTSLLRSRLMDAFPNLKIDKEKVIKKNKDNK